MRVFILILPSPVAEVNLRRSIGLLIALLSKPRRFVKVESSKGSYEQRPCTASLVITPHRDLAFQYVHWAKCMHATKHLGRGKVDSLIQVIVKGGSTSIAEQVRKVAENPPSILVATPQALLEALSLQSPLLILREMKTVVVDEADYLLETLPATKDKYALLKFARMAVKHPTPTRQILDALYRINRVQEWRKHRVAKALTDSAHDAMLAKLPSGIVKSYLPVVRPQLVFASATLSAQFRHSLYAEGKWLTHDEAQQAKILVHDDAVTKEGPMTNIIGGESIIHSALVVSPEGDILNIKGAEDPFPNPPTPTPESDLDGPHVTDEGPLLEDALRHEREQVFKGELSPC